MFFFINFIPSIIGFKAPATPIMEGIIDLHNYIFFFLIVVFIIVFWMYCYILFNFYLIPTFFYDFSISYYMQNSTFIKSIEFILISLKLQKENDFSLKYNNNKFTVRDIIFENLKKFLQVKAVKRHLEILETRKLTEYTLIEIIWTVIPSFILVLIAIPSFALLYAMDEVVDPALTVKIIGYQWFWTYEYNELSLGLEGLGYKPFVAYDSVMISEADLSKGQHRLLEVDNPLVLPSQTHIRLIITGADVIHSWAVPSFGIKVDAVPGRMSQTSLYINYEGTFYGQCSELCGVNHGFMPIETKVLSFAQFHEWFLGTLEKDEDPENIFNIAMAEIKEKN